MAGDKKNGVTISKWNGHAKYRWRVSFPDGGKRRSKGFRKRSGEGGADEFAEGMREKVVSQGVEDAHFSKSERLAVLAFRNKAKELAEVGEIVTLEDVVREWSDRQRVEIKREKVSVLVDRYQTFLDTKAKKRGGGALSTVYKRTVRQRLEPFREEFGDWTASAITKELLQDWLHGLKKIQKRPTGKGARGQFGKRAPKGEVLSPRTRNHFRATLSGFFNFAIDEKATISNPAAEIGDLAVPDSEIGILSVSDAESLLKACDDEVLPAVAIGLFAGLRRAEILRADWEDIDLDEGKHGEICVPYRATTKNQQTRDVAISPNLRAWLEPYVKLSGPVVASEAVYRTRLEKAIEKAAIKWPKNALRHSYASYHYSLHKNKTLLREQMGHDLRSKTLELYYQRRLPKKLAVHFWSMAPSVKGREIVPIKKVY